MTTYERLRRCVALNWDIEEATLTPQTCFEGGTGSGRSSLPPAPPQSPDGPVGPGDLPNDSLEFVELIMALEEEFHLKLTDADADRLIGLTLEELAEKIDRLRGEREEGPTVTGESA